MLYCLFIKLLNFEPFSSFSSGFIILKSRFLSLQAKVICTYSHVMHGLAWKIELMESVSHNASTDVVCICRLIIQSYTKFLPVACSD